MGLLLTRRSVLRLTALAGSASVARAQGSLPNFVFLISDDHSAPYLGCYGDPHIQTPNLDRIAQQGMRFENCFVASPQCSPNRSAILTGCTPHQTSTSRLHAPMPEDQATVLEPLKERGYFVGAFGKVHQGDAFNQRWHFYAEAGESFESFFDRLPANRPFFLHVGSADPHRPYRPGAFSPPHDPAKVTVPAFLPDTSVVRRDLADHYDAIARMDAECGRVLEILSERKLESGTLVIFTGDNGMPFPRAKGTCYEAGIRVPLIARWPGKIAPGSVATELISHVDLPATWLEAAGCRLPRKMQGRSFLPRLLGRSYKPRPQIFCERNWHVYFDPSRCVRTNRYKLIFNALPQLPFRPAHDLETGASWQHYLDLAQQGKLNENQMQLLERSRPQLELYNLKLDPLEFHNRISDPELAEIRGDLTGRLSDWMHETSDFLPPLFRNYPAGSGTRRPAYL